MKARDGSLGRSVAWSGALVGCWWVWNHMRPEALPHKLLVIRFYKRACRRQPLQTLRYLLWDREITNFTYDLANNEQIGEFLAHGLSVSCMQVQAALNELESDHVLRDSLNSRLQRRRDRNHVALYGRRAGWYAVARLCTPELIVETGIHDGLGSAVLLQALERNAAEGRAGRLVSFDKDHKAGWLVPEGLRGRWTRIIADARTALEPRLEGSQVDLFIHDSDHAFAHERFEFETVIRYASPGAILISDNSHVSPVLSEFSRLHGRRYSFFKEVPKHHFYPGGGIGLSIPAK